MGHVSLFALLIIAFFRFIPNTSKTKHPALGILINPAGLKIPGGGILNHEQNHIYFDHYFFLWCNML